MTTLRKLQPQVTVKTSQNISSKIEKNHCHKCAKLATVVHEAEAIACHISTLNSTVVINHRLKGRITGKCPNR
jgi:hypothetical protein